MSSAPPQGSEIKIDTLNGHQHIFVPHGKGGAIRYFVGIFLLIWMGGWFVGFTSAFSHILSGEGGAFLIFWLGGWSVGGLFAGYMIYRLFQKKYPRTTSSQSSITILGHWSSSVKNRFWYAQPKRILEIHVPKANSH